MKKSCKKVVVKKNKAQRIGVCIFTLMFMIAQIIFVLSISNAEKNR